MTVEKGSDPKASPSLLAGACPSCGGKEVYTTRGLPTRGERSQIAVSSFATLCLDTYVCLGCGRFEEHVSPAELAGVASKIREKWSRV
jgi:DNA-directed RNA polymerase subunit RPC12/RpoP